jgi:hypothetical protein
MASEKEKTIAFAIDKYVSGEPGCNGYNRLKEAFHEDMYSVYKNVTSYEEVKEIYKIAHYAIKRMDSVALVTFLVNAEKNLLNINCTDRRMPFSNYLHGGVSSSHYAKQEFVTMSIFTNSVWGGHANSNRGYVAGKLLQYECEKETAVKELLFEGFVEQIIDGLRSYRSGMQFEIIKNEINILNYKDVMFELSKDQNLYF